MEEVEPYLSFWDTPQMWQICRWLTDWRDTLEGSGMLLKQKVTHKAIVTSNQSMQRGMYFSCLYFTIMIKLKLGYALFNTCTHFYAMEFLVCFLIPVTPLA